MASSKRRTATRGREGTAARKPRAPQRRVVAPELPLRQGLVEMATIGAQSFVWLATVVASIAAVVGLAYGAWALRPVPVYASDGVKTGSAFLATFRVENASPWFPLSHLKIRCTATRLESAEMPPVDADTSRLPSRLEPGASAVFTCPFRPLPASAASVTGASDDLDVALKSELYFQSAYDMPGLDSFRLGHTGGPYVLDTRLLPPRWTAKPARD